MTSVPTDSIPSEFGLDVDVVDADALGRSVERFAELGIRLPRFAELSQPETIADPIREELRAVDPLAPDPRNLFRIHWHNSSASDQAAIPEHVVLPPTFTGVDAPVVVVLGNRFPMIRTHKVLAAYACLAPRVVTGRFDPSRHRAIWPSTGNYARGGVAISRIMGCRGAAVLPAGMSRERFDWLDSWVADPHDIVRTPGSESNVKEIYDACARLALEPGNFILNQFREFANHLVHYEVTGRALERTVEHLRDREPRLRMRAFVSASGSAGTLGAGDRLKERYGSRTVAVEALECPTLLYNGFGEHNIQGIGDKHVPLIHNVMNTDVVVGVSDRATDELSLCFDEPDGVDHLVRRQGVPLPIAAALPSFGLSSICNVVAAIKTAKALRYGPDDLIVTVATDGADMYGSERDRVRKERFADGFGPVEAAAVVGQHLLGAAPDHVVELDDIGRNRIFNLGYFTWVEQQGVSIEAFEARRDQSFWSALRGHLARWDALIDDVNARVASRARH